jgi:hypothetical protein
VWLSEMFHVVKHVAVVECTTVELEPVPAPFQTLLNAVTHVKRSLLREQYEPPKLENLSTLRSRKQVKTASALQLIKWGYRNVYVKQVVSVVAGCPTMHPSPSQTHAQLTTQTAAAAMRRQAAPSASVPSRSQSRNWT